MSDPSGGKLPTLCEHGIPQRACIDCQAKHQPHAEVERIGRWTYHVSISDWLHVPPGVPVDATDRAGLWWPIGAGSWHVLGRKRAEKLAARKLRRHLRKRQWEAEPVARIEPEEVV